MKWVRRSVLNADVFRGTWLNMGSAISAEVAGIAGYDWVLIDLEHGSGDSRDLYYQLLALERSRTGAIVRVPTIDSRMFTEVLDLGPAGLMIPNVSDSEMANQLVQYARTRPKGMRGAATSTRASGYGSTYRQYIEECNDNLLLVAQIESVEGLANAGSIASVDGIDVLFVGPTDLSISLDTKDDVESQVFRAALVNIAQAAICNGKVAGALVRNIQELPAYLSLGYTFIAVGSDRGMIYRGMEDTLNKFDSIKVRC